ncbi:glycosyltransferase family 59 protein [Schizophyllum commune]
MSALYAAFCAAAVSVLKEVNKHVTEPYMDEPFHVPQAQAYCAGNFSHWDPKITTPPGLYIVSVILKRFFIVKCALPTLRLTPLLALLILPLVLTRFLAYQKRVHPPSILSPSPAAVVLALHPLVFFYGFLYYTDVPSLLSVVTTIVLAQEERHWLAALAGAISCTFRQTNIVWVLYAYAASQIAYLRYRRNGVRLHDPLARQATFGDIPWSAFSLASLLPDILPAFVPYALVLAGFGGFLVWNGGIVLGDKSNHVPAFHVPQLYYLISCATAFCWPTLLRVPGLPSRILRKMFGGKLRTTCTILLCAVVCATINRYTIHHPFLLADNRHYTFYLWRRVILVHPAVKYLLAPVYIACGWAWWVAVGASSDNTLFQVLLIPLTAAPTLLPAPLLEPRYFVVPLVLMRGLLEGDVDEDLSDDAKEKATNAPRLSGFRLSPNTSLALEFAWYAVINAVTLYIFVYCPRGEVRFMW